MLYHCAVGVLAEPACSEQLWGLNVVENWNATNDFMCYGRQGEPATNGREPQEVVTLPLQLPQNCLMLINTMPLERTIERKGLWVSHLAPSPSF